MKVFSPFALLLGLLMSGPALWQAFSDPTTALAPAVIRFVVASVVAGIGITVISGLVSAYAESNRAAASQDAVEAESDGSEPSAGSTPDDSSSDTLVSH